tara:strand:- start:64 stop:249 length:186 start_codon:yes stop_codon:yes gene_type:complete
MKTKNQNFFFNLCDSQYYEFSSVLWLDHNLNMIRQDIPHFPLSKDRFIASRLIPLAIKPLN